MSVYSQNSSMQNNIIKESDKTPKRKDKYNNNNKIFNK